MYIKKILNNSVVLTEDLNGQEIVVMGKGIAYAKKSGDVIDKDKVTKTFRLEKKAEEDILLSFLSQIPVEYMEVTNQIIDRARTRLDVEFHDTIYIAIMDHIYSSVERAKNGLQIQNKMLWEIKHFYKNEYDIGLYALGIIEKEIGVTMPEDEAGFIALHLVSATADGNFDQVYKITDFIQEVMQIVRYHYQYEFDSDSFVYYRFVTHLKFFGRRVFSSHDKAEVSLLKEDILNLLKEEYTEAYRCSQKIGSFIEKKYYYEIDSDEILYLTLHIARLTKFTFEGGDSGKTSMR